MLKISSRNWARRHKREFAAVLTVEDPGRKQGIRFHRPNPPDHLILKFVDLDRPLPDPWGQQPRYRLATLDDVQAALEFSQDRESLLIHCQAGVGRSTALGLGVLMQRLQDEVAVFRALEDICLEAVPNRHIVQLLDRLFGSTLLDYLEDWDTAHPSNAERRLRNRKSHFLEAGAPLEPGMEKLF